MKEEMPVDLIKLWRTAKFCFRVLFFLEPLEIKCFMIALLQVCSSRLEETITGQATCSMVSAVDTVGILVLQTGCS